MLKYYIMVHNMHAKKRADCDQLGFCIKIFLNHSSSQSPNFEIESLPTIFSSFSITPC